MAPTFVRSVTLKNYKSIARCKVTLQPITYLVGHNGAGKGNFVDALRLVADALRAPLDHALRERGGLNEVRRRSTGHPTNFSIRLDVSVPNMGEGHYAFEVGAKKHGAFEVVMEECHFPDAHFVVRRGDVTSTTHKVMPPALSDRLFLTNAAGLPAFRPLYDGLSQMGFYNLAPSVMLVAIEEPEVALHPAAAGVLLDALRDASRERQVLVTSHSPELLDSEAIRPEHILAVVSHQGRTDLAPLDDAGTLALRDHLYTAGELLRLNQLLPDENVIEAVNKRQLTLFEAAT